VEVVVAGSEQAKQPVSGILAGPYGHPYHPILVTVPIGAWVSSLVFDLASLVTGQAHLLAVGSQWLIAIGVVGAVLAAMVGFLDLVAIPAGTKAYRTGLLHMGLNLAVTAAYAVNFAWRLAAPGAPASGVPVGPLVLSVLSLIGLTASGYLGGMLAYRYGVRVAAESTQAEGFAE
jgi:uncharacterized membrane protein